MRAILFVCDLVIELAEAVCLRYDEELGEWEARHDREQVERVRRAYPDGWRRR